MSNPTSNRPRRARLELLAQIASLIATAWIVSNAASLPRAAMAAPATALQRAGEFTLLAWGWSAIVALAIQLAIRSVERIDIVGVTLRTSLAAVWFAPATLLLYRFSVAALLASMVLVINATRLLYAQWRLVHPLEDLDLPIPSGVLMGEGTLPPPILTRHLGPALTVAFGLQFGATAAMFEDHFLVACLLGLSAAMLTVFAISSGAWETSRPATMPRSIFGAILTLVLAAALTLFAVGGRGGESGDEASWLPAFFGGGRGPASASQQANAQSKQAQQAAEQAQREGPPQGAFDVPGSFPGVILWPEVQPVTRLIVPVPSRSGWLAASKVPYGIPFGGEYWLFRSPFLRPPRGSFQERGSPAKVSFSTTDRWPLHMEAHQKLEKAIETACCSRIQVMVTNADRFPGTLSLELVLHDQAHPRMAEFLGSEPVKSVPSPMADPPWPVSETLEFSMPAEPRLKTFDELTVVFRSAMMRRDRSARVAIDRFVLVPRGM